MFIVRNIYVEKAKNYILRQGYARFTEGSLGHDVINAISRYGIVPRTSYTGLRGCAIAHDHKKLFLQLKGYLDGLLYPAAQDLVSTSSSPTNPSPRCSKELDGWISEAPRRGSGELLAGNV